TGAKMLEADSRRRSVARAWRSKINVLPGGHAQVQMGSVSRIGRTQHGSKDVLLSKLFGERVKESTMYPFMAVVRCVPMALHTYAKRCLEFRAQLKGTRSCFGSGISRYGRVSGERLKIETNDIDCVA